MGAAILPAMALHSPLADLETVATQRLQSYQRRHLGGMNIGCATVYGAISAWTLHPPVLIIMGRSWLGWCGLALVTRATLGWRLAGHYRSRPPSFYEPLDFDINNGKLFYRASITAR